MINKIIEIEYNPYTNHISFGVSIDAGNTWQDVTGLSSLLNYQNQDCVLSNCVEDILEYIDQYQNSSAEGLMIRFIGTEEDYAILNATAEIINNRSNKKGKICTSRAGTYTSANEALSIIRGSYCRIASEFEDYLLGKDKYTSDSSCKKIGDTISLFTNTISPEIPICVIGTYSVGKSAFINAIIGDEILPSKVDPCTAKNIRVESHSDVSIAFEYKKQSVIYLIRDGGLILHSENTEVTSEITKALSAHCVFSNKQANIILHDILEAFNENTTTFPEVEDIGWNVVIGLPFVDSILNQKECKIVIYDTPGSNNNDIDQKAHRDSLEKMMRSQTNALPVFLMDRNQVISNDNNEVRSLLDKNKEGFSNPNCLIVFSKAENIPSSAFNQTIPASFLNWHGKATFLYVCAVGAIGIKKRNNTWLDPEYEDVYNAWALKYNSFHISLPEHNIIPCGRKMDKELRESLSEELFATGIPSVEDEINYYIQRYANYKKCVNGKELLQNALSLAKNQLDKQKQRLSKIKSEKEKEQKFKKDELVKSIDATKIAGANIQDIINKYHGELDAFCVSLPQRIKEIWDSAQKRTDTFEYLKEGIQKHCTDNLFKATYESKTGIRNEIICRLTNCANDYKVKLQQIVNGKKSDLSNTAKDELDSLFEQLSLPAFSQVNVTDYHVSDYIIKIPNGKIKELIENKYLDIIAKGISKQLKGHKGNFIVKDKLGVFAEQCIQQPVQAYFSQLLTWKANQIASIKKTLNKDNAILSKYDSEIVALEQQIKSLEKRLNNLTDVEDVLSCVLLKQEVK